MSRKDYKVKVSREECKQVAGYIAARDYDAVKAWAAGVVVRYPNDVSTAGSWAYNAIKLLEWFQRGIHSKPIYKVFNKAGNKKLPFATFGAIPDITCPGAGDCLDYCYSYKAFRYANVFARFVQNTILVLEHSSIIEEEFAKLKEGTTLRLYVDGDFDSLETIRFWMNLIQSRPDIKVYGYSKSWPEFIAYGKESEFPSNYVLNISGGSKHSEEVKARVRKLSCTRGDFTAFSVSTMKLPKPSEDRWMSYVKEVKAKAYEAGFDKSFVCPGSCGSCTKVGHACGAKEFQGIPIIIGVH